MKNSHRPDDGAVLMNLLPGLREIRTPLAAGYIWLTAVWFLVHDHIAPRAEASGVVLSAYELVDVVGTPVALAAASFLAYIVGTAQVRPDAVRKGVLWVARPAGARYVLRGIPRDAWDGRPPAISQSAVSALHNLIAAMEVELDPMPIGGSHPMHQVAMKDVTGDLRSLALHLQVKMPNLFQDYDRTASEAEFRVNIGLAIGGLSVALMIASGNSWFLMGILVVIVMLRSGIYRQQVANDLLIETLTSRIVRCLALDEYDAALRRSAERHRAEETYEEAMAEAEDEASEA